MRQKRYMNELSNYCLLTFVPAVIARSEKFLDRLQRAGVDVQREPTLTITFEFAKLFDVVWLSAAEDGIQLPVTSSWANDFKAFHQTMMCALDVMSNRGMSVQKI